MGTETDSYYLKELQKEREAKERAQALARSLATQMKKKNDEIEKLTFFLEVACEVFLSIDATKVKKAH